MCKTMYTKFFSFYFQLENDQTGLKWKWSVVKQGGIRVSPRCSASAIIVTPSIAYMFGGVYDEEDNDEELHGTFYNDLIALNLSKLQWHTGNTLINMAYIYLIF